MGVNDVADHGESDVGAVRADVVKRAEGGGMAESQYFAGDPDVASHPRLITMRLPDLTLDLTVDRGVFSGTRLDPGTGVLLREAPWPPPSGEVLDIGCGYGPIAFALAHRAPGARVWAIDTNRRALDLVRSTAVRLGVSNVRAAEPGDVPSGLRFAAIYSNPPIRIGKEALHEVLLEWLVRLEAGGAAHLVVQRHLGSDSLAAWLGSHGFGVERIAAKRAYRVLTVRPLTTSIAPM